MPGAFIWVFSVGNQKSLGHFAVLLERPAGAPPPTKKKKKAARPVVELLLSLLDKSSILSPLPFKTGLALHLKLASFLVLGGQACTTTPS